MPTEIELKLALDPAATPAVLRHPAVVAARAGRMRTNRLLAHYYDSPDERLAQHDVALRVRRVGRRWIQTLKGPADVAGGAGLQVRGEWEWPVRDARPDPALAATTPWHKLVTKTLRRGPLARRFSTEFERRALPLVFPDGTRAELAVDQGHIRAMGDGRLRRVPLCEVEIELAQGDAANLYRLALALAADLPLAVLTTSKAERGHALRHGLQPFHGGPVHATHTALAPDATAAEALAAIARECLGQIAANAPGLLADRDPEWVHQMRVGTRRLRSCLSLAAAALPDAPLDEVRAEIRWLAETLGRARDWDVLATQTLPPFVEALARDDAFAPGVTRIRHRVAARRRLAAAAAREAVASRRFQRLLLATALFVAGFGPRAAAADPAPAANAPDTLPPDAGAATAVAASAPRNGERADTFAAALLARRDRKLRQRGKAIAQASDRDRHAARIAAKRVRYAAEFFAPLFPRRRTRAYIEALADLQDALGEYNDAVTAAARAGELAGAADGAAAAALCGWMASRRAALEPRLAKAWRSFESCDPFWR
jgi:inorganic triphosphatase YgiF